MNAAAVRTSALLCLHCRRLPALFFDCSSGIGGFDVDGQRTSKLLISRRVFAFARRGGSKKNLVAISEGNTNRHDWAVMPTPIFLPRLEHRSSRKQPAAPDKLRSQRRGSWPRGFQRASVIGVLDGLSDGAGLVATFFFIRYQIIIASRREISLARQFSRVNLVNRMEINFARHCFGTGLFIIAVQQNFRDMLAKSSEANPKRASVADSTYAT